MPGDDVQAEDEDWSSSEEQKQIYPFLFPLYTIQVTSCPGV